MVGSREVVLVIAGTHLGAGVMPTVISRESEAVDPGARAGGPGSTTSWTREYDLVDRGVLDTGRVDPPACCDTAELQRRCVEL